MMSMMYLFERFYIVNFEEGKLIAFGVFIVYTIQPLKLKNGLDNLRILLSADEIPLSYPYHINP